jgi:uncharacterized membrane protein YeaQ/YmgE (transglycosylase-associated protein family)
MLAVLERAFSITTDVDRDILSILALLIVFFSFPAGWISDSILSSNGFGIFGNYLLIVLGAFIGLTLMHGAGFDLEEAVDAVLPVVTVTLSGGLAMLLLGCFAKR